MTESNQNPSQFEMPRAGEQHQRLAPFVGNFRAKVTIFGGPTPQVSTGTMVNSWQVDGLYLHQDYTGDSPGGNWPAFLGRGYWGYNFSSRKYEGFWIDNASSMMQTESGDVDNSGQVWTMLSEFINPQNGGTVKRRSVIKLIDDNHHTMESFMSMPDGQEHKMMEINYQRA